MADKTTKIEDIAKNGRKSSIKDIFKLFLFVFSSTRKISSIYLGLFILLSIIRPMLAFIWMHYITSLDTFTMGTALTPTLLLLLSYWALSFLSEMIDSFMAVDGNGDLEQLDAVQANRQQEFMHSKLYRKINAMKSEYHEITQVHDEIQQVFDFLGNRASGANREVMLKSYIVIAKIVSLVSISITLFIFNRWLCILLLIAPLPVIWTSSIGERIRFKFTKDNMQLQRRAGYFQNLLLSSTSKEITAMGLHDYFYGKWKEAADRFTVNEKKSIRHQTLLALFNSIVSNVVNISGIVYTIVLMAMGNISIGVFGAVLSLIGTLVNDTTLLLSSIASLLGKQQEARLFFDIMAIPDLKDEGMHIDALRVIEAKALKYRYPMTDHYVLDGVDLTISQGERVAFVGENGAGKTTLIKLITGLLMPSDGELMMNGICVEEINPFERFRAQSAVTQEPSQYQTFTVRENVYIGDTSKPCSDDEIASAMRFAGIDDLGLDILLGKEIGGEDLSGGEWQKLAIARVIYRNHSFMILDEPTSNLDPLAEAEVFQKYMKLAEDRTVLFVTHRISMAALADRILVFKDGKIIQDGTHDELIKQEGKYSDLYTEQAQWYLR